MFQHISNISPYTNDLHCTSSSQSWICRLPLFFFLIENGCTASFEGLFERDSAHRNLTGAIALTDPEQPMHLDQKPNPASPTYCSSTTCCYFPARSWQLQAPVSPKKQDLGLAKKKRTSLGFPDDAEFMISQCCSQP